MKIKTMRYPIMLLVALLATGVAAKAQAGPDFSKVEIKTTKITDNFYTLEGRAAPSVSWWAPTAFSWWTTNSRR